MLKKDRFERAVAPFFCIVWWNDNDNCLLCNSWFCWSFAVRAAKWGIHSCPDDVIIALIDGDDWLAHPNVFREINQIYSKKNVWLTHGSFTEYPSFHSSSKSNWAWSTPIPTNIIQRNLFRNYFVPAHLRTFYVALFKKIDIKDLLYKDNFLATTGDVAIMIPMIEMAGERHHFMRKINYIYNTSNALNDRKIKPKLQEQLVHFIRKKQRYTRIYSLFS